MFPLINVDVLRNSCHKEGTTEWEDSSLVAQCARWGRFRFLPRRFQTELQKLWKPSPASNFVSGSCFDTGFALVRFVVTEIKVIDVPTSADSLVNLDFLLDCRIYFRFEAL